MPEVRHVLFVGPSVAMQRWMNEHRSYAQPEWRVHLALNGPEHLRGIRGPIKIVHERGWVPGEGQWAVDEAITMANRINGQLAGEGLN